MIINLIQNYIKPYFGARKISATDFLDDLYLDSVAKADIIEQIERALKIKNLYAEPITKCKTVGEFINAVEKAHAKQHNKKHSAFLCEYRQNVPYCRLTGYKCRKLANKQTERGVDACLLIKCETAKRFYALAKQVGNMK